MKLEKFLLPEVPKMPIYYYNANKFVLLQNKLKYSPAKSAFHRALHLFIAHQQDSMRLILLI